MPTRQKKAPPLQTAEEIQKEKKPTSTSSMGMKMTHTSSECWKSQVKAETHITEDWKKTYHPTHAEEEEAALTRLTALETHRAELRDADPLRPLLYEGHSKEGKGRKQYLTERHKIDPQEKQDAPATLSQTVGWNAVRFGSTLDSPLTTQRHLYHVNKGRSGVPTAGGGGGGGGATMMNSTNNNNNNTNNNNATVGGAHIANDPLENVHSISYNGVDGTCVVQRQ